MKEEGEVEAIRNEVEYKVEKKARGEEENNGI